MPAETMKASSTISADGTKGSAKKRTRIADAAEPHRDPHQAAQARHHHGFDQELEEHVALARADREPDADLARALGDRDEHDVHDPDAADEQTDRGDGGEEDREDAGRLLHHLIDLGDVVDLEIVRCGGRQMPALAHQLGDVADHLGNVLRAARRDPDHARHRCCR